MPDATAPSTEALPRNYLEAILLKSGSLRATGTVVRSGSRVALGMRHDR
jgi:hypothetical protein